MPQIEDPKATAVAQALKTEISTTDWPKEGSVVEVTLLKKLHRKAYFDMGRFGTGIVFGAEIANAREAIRNLKPGDKLQAKIVTLDGEEGDIELSLSEAGKQKLWAASQRNSPSRARSSRQRSSARTRADS